MEIKKVALSIDVACFVLMRDDLHVLLVRRAREPYRGVWALPGGIVLPDEYLDAEPTRLLHERALHGTPRAVFGLLVRALSRRTGPEVKLHLAARRYKDC